MIQKNLKANILFQNLTGYLLIFISTLRAQLSNKFEKYKFTRENVLKNTHRYLPAKNNTENRTYIPAFDPAIMYNEILDNVQTQPRCPFHVFY